MTWNARSFSISRRRWHATCRSLSEEPTKGPRRLPGPDHPLFFGQRIELSGYLFVSAPSLRHHFARVISPSRLINASPSNLVTAPPVGLCDAGGRKPATISADRNPVRVTLKVIVAVRIENAEQSPLRRVEGWRDVTKQRAALLVL